MSAPIASAACVAGSASAALVHSVIPPTIGLPVAPVGGSWELVDAEVTGVLAPVDVGCAGLELEAADLVADGSDLSAVHADRPTTARLARPMPIPVLKLMS